MFSGRTIDWSVDALKTVSGESGMIMSEVIPNDGRETTTELDGELMQMEVGHFVSCILYPACCTEMKDLRDISDFRDFF